MDSISEDYFESFHLSDAEFDFLDSVGATQSDEDGELQSDEDGELQSDEDKELQEYEDELLATTNYFNLLVNSQRMVLDIISYYKEVLEIDEKKIVELEKPIEKEKPDSSNNTTLRYQLAFASPYFTTKEGQCAPTNEDAIKRTTICPVNAYFIQQKAWDAHLRKRLVSGVKSHVMNLVFQPLELKKNSLKKKILYKEGDENDHKKEISRLDDEADLISKKPFAEIYAKFEDKINWTLVSTQYMSSHKSAESCSRYYHNYLKFSINTETFSEEEDKVLQTHAGNKSWDEIATFLSNRTSLQCFKRYQKYLNKNLYNTFWTPEEDEKLCKLIERHRINDYIPYHRVCSELGKRAQDQVRARYIRILDKSKNKGPWSLNEDAMLVACIKAFGCEWNDMLECLPTRSSYKIRERYTQCLRPEIKLGNWTFAEDCLLLKYAAFYGRGKWTKIANHVPGRRDNSCLTRFTRLQKNKKDYVKSCMAVSESKTDEEIRNFPDLEEGTKRWGIPFNPMVKWNNSCSILLEAYNKITGQEHKNIDEIDFRKVTISTINALKEELLKDCMCSSTLDWAPHYFKSYKSIDYQLGKEVYKYSSESCSETETSEEESTEDSEEYNSDDEIFSLTNPKTEGQKLTAKAFKQFLTLKSILPNAKPRKPTLGLTQKQAVEYYLLKRSISEGFEETSPSCPAKFVFDGNDFKVTVPRILDEIVMHPTFEPDQFPVLPPTSVTLGVGYTLLHLRDWLVDGPGKFSGRSRPLISYFNGKSKQPMCSHCVSKRHFPQLEKLLSCNKELKKKNDFVVLNEKLKASIDYEIGEAPPPDVCKCDKIPQWQKNFCKFEGRMASLFYWPMVTASVSFKNEQKNLIEKVIRAKNMASGFNKTKCKLEPITIEIKTEELSESISESTSDEESAECNSPTIS